MKTLVSILPLLLLCSCGTLLKTNKLLGITGQEIGEQKTERLDQEVDHSATVADGTSVQATTSINGDGMWLAIKDTVPKLAYALAAVLIVRASKSASFFGSFGMNSARSRGNNNELV
jgi:hypothetical protein